MADDEHPYSPPPPRTSKLSLTSPNSVMQQVQQQMQTGIPGVPNMDDSCNHLDCYVEQHVKFEEAEEDLVQYFYAKETYENEEDLWWSREEIKDFHKRAKFIDAKEAREKHESLIEDLETLFQESKKKSSLQTLMSQPFAQRIMEGLPKHDMRGLEQFLHTMVRQSRLYHRLCLLKLQESCPPEDSEALEHLLKCQSRQSSRASRILARLVAQGDYHHLAEMLKEELVSTSTS